MSKAKPLAALQLPFPPTVNTYWRSVWKPGWRHPRVLISERGRNYRDYVAAEVWKQLGGKLMLKGPLRVTLAVTMPDNRKRDLDNLLKGPLDAMEGAGVYVDDNQIHDLRITKLGVSTEKIGRLDVVIESADELPLFGGMESWDEMQNRIARQF